jgi:hypothetical protein
MVKRSERRVAVVALVGGALACVELRAFPLADGGVAGSVLPGDDRPGTTNVPDNGLNRMPPEAGVIDAGATRPDVVAMADVAIDRGPPDAGPGMTYDYVINRLIIDEGAEPFVAARGFYGFNLDGRYSPSRTAQQQAADCSHGDYFSTVDPDQNEGSCVDGAAGGGTSCRGGVDNQYATLAQTLMQFMPTFNLNTEINASINTGALLMLVRVSGVHGVLGPSLNDPSVVVRMYPVAHATFANCANIQTSGQAYAVNNRSLLTPGDLDSARVRFDGSIVNGRLIVTPNTTTSRIENFSVSAVVPSSEMLGVTLFDTRLRFNLRETEGTAGNLGGYFLQTEYLNVLTSIPALAQFRDAAGPLIQGFVDIATAGAGTTLSCDSPQGGIGIGLGFTARRATISPVTVNARPAGACGPSS